MGSNALTRHGLACPRNGAQLPARGDAQLAGTRLSAADQHLATTTLGGRDQTPKHRALAVATAQTLPPTMARHRHPPRISTVRSLRATVSDLDRASGWSTACYRPTLAVAPLPRHLRAALRPIRNFEITRTTARTTRRQGRED